MIHLVLGPDAATARQRAADLVRQHDPDDANTSRFDASETPLSQIVAAVGSLGFLGQPRVVLVRDLMAKAGKGKGGEDGEASAGALDLAPLFAATPAENVLILLDPTLGSVPAAVKRAAGNAAEIVACEPPRGRDLLRWLVAAAADAGGRLTEEGAKALAIALYPQTWQARPTNPRYDRPPDMDLLRNTVEMLALSAHPDAVTPEHVRQMVSGGPDDRIFAFVEAAANGDVAAAARQLEQLLAAGEEPAKLAAQVFNQIELAAVAGAATRTDPAELGRRIGLSNPNQMVAIARSRRAGSPDALLRQVLSALEAERAFKSGRLRQPIDELHDVLARMAVAVAAANATGR